MAKAQNQRGKKTKRPDTRPARARYWASGRLMKRKVRGLMKTGQFKTEAEAKVYWLSVRKKRIKTSH